MKHINKLIIESSPYLLQHAHNPVNWVPYSNLVFEEAKQCNKPIIISIGYSSCHWCHVMEHESFEDESIAAFMNEHFICVKVDREEHPDVDMVYMDVVQQIHGNGGWPLNCFALPDGRPFWGGTYFNPKQWKQLLDNIIVLFQENYNELENQAEQLKNGLISRSSSILSDDINSDSETDSSLVFQNLYNSFDHEKGGFKGAPKFPMPVVLRFLIYYGIHMKNNNAVKMVETTLLNMAKSGIYDQVGGGFARYATDSDWKVPHFEKMLYDNAQLISVYSDMFKLTGDRFYKTVIEQTIEFIDRELTASEGIFYSALDADSENKEGLYYTWTEDEFKAVLGHYASLAAEYYGVGGDGLWEDNRNIILRPASDDLFAQQHFLSADELVSFTSYCRNQLLKVRSERNPPGLDDKMIVSWNSLMISALIDSYTALGTEKYLLKAIVAAKFLLNNMKRDNGGLLHTWKNGVSQIDAFLDDYALTCEAFLKLYSITTHEFWLHETESLLNYVMEHFYDEQTNLFWFSEIGSKYVFARKTETHDGVIPSGNSIMAGIMQILGLFLHNENYISKSKKMLQAISASSVRYPAAYANWVRLALLESQKLTLVAVVGANSVSVIKELSSKNLPGVVIFGSEQQSSLPYFTERFVSGKTLIYICKDNYCLAPVENVNEALKYLTSA